jgi:hypothetical protein
LKSFAVIAWNGIPEWRKKIDKLGQCPTCSPPPVKAQNRLSAASGEDSAQRVHSLEQGHPRLFNYSERKSSLLNRNDFSGHLPISCNTLSRVNQV